MKNIEKNKRNHQKKNKISDAPLKDTNNIQKS